MGEEIPVVGGRVGLGLDDQRREKTIPSVKEEDGQLMLRRRLSGDECLGKGREGRWTNVLEDATEAGALHKRQIVRGQDGWKSVRLCRQRRCSSRWTHGAIRLPSSVGSAWTPTASADTERRRAVICMLNGEASDGGGEGG